MNEKRHDPALLAAQSRPNWKMMGMFILFTTAVLPIYIYHNPVRWEAFRYNYSAFFLILRPYTFLNHLGELLCLFWMLLIGWGLGIVILRKIRNDHAAENLLDESLPLGWGTLGTLLFFLALMKGFTAWGITILLSLLTLPALYGLFLGREVIREFPQRLRRFVLKPWDERIAWLLVFICMLFAFFSSLMPPTQSDGLRYHLTVPKIYLNEGGFTLLPHLAFSNFPFLIEYLFAVPLAYNLISGPKLIHFMYFMTTLGLVYGLGKRLSGARTGAYAVLLVSTTPFVPIFASWSFIEFGLTAYTVLAFFYTLEMMGEMRQGNSSSATRYALLAGIAAGFMLSCKYTALATLFFLIGIALLSRLRAGKENFTLGAVNAFWLCGIAGLIVLPWYIKNWILLGNPLYPFAASLFPTPGWTDFNGLFFQYHAGLKGNLIAVSQFPLLMKISDFLTLPFRITFFPGHQGQQESFGEWPIGAAWLILSLMLLFWRGWNWRGTWHGVFALFLYFVWAYTYRDTRFLLPAMAVAAPLFAQMAVETVRGALLGRWLFFLPILYGICFPASLLLIPPTYAPWWVVSGKVTQEDYLQRISDFTRWECQAFQFLEENVPPDERVMLHGIEQTFYCPNPYLGADWFNTDPLIAWSWETPTVQGLLDRLHDQKIRYIVYNYGRIGQYHDYYQFFLLPPDEGYKMLQELVNKEPVRVTDPVAYRSWFHAFRLRLSLAVSMHQSSRALETLLKGGGLQEVFRYDEAPENGNEGIVILRIPEAEIRK